MTGSHSEDELDRFAAWERSVWEQRAGAYATSFGDLTRGSIPALLDAAGVTAGMRVLDVGTGPGFVALQAIRRGATVCAVDGSAAMVAVARSAGVDAQVADVTSLPFADGSFDAVVAGYLLNHLARPERAVAEIARVLRPGGRFALTVWDTPERNRATGSFGSVVAALGLPDVVPPGPLSQRFADEDELRRLLTEWDEIRVERVRWSITVEPGAWFDAVAASTPRTGAVLAAAGPEVRASARERYVAEVFEAYGMGAGLVELPAAAVLASVSRPGPRAGGRPPRPG